MLSVKKGGGGLVNTLINKLPFELHVPGYQFCGPGTNLKKRLSRGDLGINPLDKACKEHDIAYSQSSDLHSRHQADKILEERAWFRATSRDAGIGERIAATAVTNIMKAKRKMGMGLKQKRVGFRKNIFAKAKDVLKHHRLTNIKEGVKMSLKAARAAVKTAGGRKRIRTPRIIPIPKSGGFLPLIPLFAGLSALGGLAGGAAGIASAVNKAKNAYRDLEEAKRHNKTMEAIALGKKGSGLYLKPYRKGLGLYMKPYSQCKVKNF